MLGNVGLERYMFRKKSNTESDCNPQFEELIKFIDEQNVEEIRNIIERHPDIVKQPFNDYPYPILDIALKDKAKTASIEVIEVLIELGASLYYENEEWNTDGWDAIHFAACGVNPEFLKCIIAHIDPDKINSTTNKGNTALLLLITSYKIAKLNPDDPYFIECIEVLLENNININKVNNENASAIYYAAREKCTEVINILLKHKNIDLDSVTIGNETARNLLQSMNVDVSHIPIYISEDRELLLQYLKLNKETEFVELASKIGVKNEDINEQTYLQYACINNSLKVVEFLLSQNVDVNETSKQNAQSPIEIAAHKGYHKIFKLLIEEPLTNVKNTILSVILKKNDCPICDDINYYLCFVYLMKSKNIDVNVKDENGDYPLHYSAKYGGPEVAPILLNFKSSLGNKNCDGILTIENVDSETLNEHLDNCIEATKPQGSTMHLFETINLDYATLLPTSEKEDFNSVFVEVEPLNNKVKRIVAETEAILYMSRSSELKLLLKHPVITSFLDMKWHKIRWIFFMNVLFYLTFCLFLVLHSFRLFNGTKNQVFYVFLIIMLTLLTLRELHQFISAPSKWKYFLNIENVFEIFLIIIVIGILSIKTAYDKNRNQLCAYAFLLAAFDLLFLLGNYPSLSRKIVMLRTVSFKFFGFLFSFLSVLIAFPLSFHVLFNDSINSSLPLLANSTEAEHISPTFSGNILISIFKTFIMLTGEFNSDNINFEQYPITSRLIFLLFVITIVLIVLNLALSDTQEIQNEAELVPLIVRAQYIFYAESIIFKGFKLFTRHAQNGNKILLHLSNLFHFLVEEVCLFPNDLGNNKVIVYPNQKGLTKIDGSKNELKNFYLDAKCIQKIKIIIQEKIEKEKRKYEMEEEKRRIDDLHNKINEISSILRDKQ